MSEAHLTLRSMKKVQGRQRLMWSMGTSGCAHAMAMACSTTTDRTLSTSSGRSQACIVKNFLLPSEELSLRLQINESSNVN